MVRTIDMSGILIGLVNFFIGLIVLALVLRLILRLFGASSSAAFVEWMYAMTEPLLAPFSGMFPSPAIEQGMVLEFSTMFAIIVYAVVGWLITELIRFVARAAAGATGSAREAYRE